MFSLWPCWVKTLILISEMYNDVKIMNVLKRHALFLETGLAQYMMLFLISLDLIHLYI